MGEMADYYADHWDDMDGRGFTTERVSAAPIMTNRSITDSPYPTTIRTYGLDRLNLLVLHQGMIWIDKSHRVHAIPELEDRHLDAIITWLQAGRTYLYRRYIRSMGSGVITTDHTAEIWLREKPMWKALVAEQDKRFVKRRAAQDIKPKKMVVSRPQLQAIIAERVALVPQADIRHRTRGIAAVIRNTLFEFGWSLEKDK